MIAAPTSSTNEDRMETPEAAALLGLAASTLATDRVRRRLRVPYYKIGRRVVYSRIELERYLAGCRVEG